MWKTYKLQDLILKTRKVRGIQTKEYQNAGEYPIIDQGSKFIAGYSNDETSHYKDDLPVVIFGDHTLAVKYIDFEFCAGADGTQILKPNEDIITGKFLYYSIIKLNIQSLGYSRHFKLLKEAIFQVPPLEEQKRIVRILDHADSLRQKRQQAISLLDDYLKAVFLEMFGDPVTNPKRWDVKPLSFFIDKERDISYGIVQRGEHYDGGTPVIRIRDIINENFDISAIVKTNPTNSEKYSRTILNGGEILLSIRGTVGAVTIAPAISKGWNISREVAIVPTKNNINDIFLLSFFRSPPVQIIFKGMIKGVAQSGLNLSDIRKMDTISPPIDLQNEFAAIVQKIEKLKVSMVSQAEELENQFQSLMQKSFKA